MAHSGALTPATAAQALATRALTPRIRSPTGRRPARGGRVRHSTVLAVVGWLLLCAGLAASAVAIWAILHDGGVDYRCSSIGSGEGHFTIAPFGILCDDGPDLIGVGNWMATAVVYGLIASGAALIVRAELLHRRDDRAARVR